VLQQHILTWKFKPYCGFGNLPRTYFLQGEISFSPVRTLIYIPSAKERKKKEIYVEEYGQQVGTMMHAPYRAMLRTGHIFSHWKNKMPHARLPGLYRQLQYSSTHPGKYPITGRFDGMEMGTCKSGILCTTDKKD
jgi:hypothetical protein